jgi:hypothetical protein
LIIFISSAADDTSLGIRGAGDVYSGCGKKTLE